MATTDERREELSHRLLGMLAAEAPLERFEGEIEGRDADSIALLGAALRVRLTLTDLRRREQELVALNETAEDLASLRDVEQVLRAIVRRGRQLLGSELAYITLVDEKTHTTYMRTVEGNVTEGFAHLRLPLGAGLGGLVAELATPVATPNCQTDGRLRHPDGHRAALTDEGLVAVLGVPLKRGGRVAGVLYAADRYQRTFSSHDIALLSCLATHAAIAIDNARMFEETRQSLHALAEAGQQASRRGEALERIAAVRERLLRAVLEGADLPEVADLLADALTASVMIVDVAGRVLASAHVDRDALARDVHYRGTITEDGPNVLELRDALARTVRAGRIQTLEGCGENIRWLAPIPAGRSSAGAVMVGRIEALDDAERSILENAALVIGLMVAGERAVAAAEERVRAELLNDLLLAPDRHPEHLRRRSQLLGVELDRPHAVAVACVDGESPGQALRTLARETGGLAGEHLGRSVLILADMAPVAAGELFASRLHSVTGHAVTVGVAGPAAGARGLAQAYEEADRCLKCAQTLDQRGIVSAERLGMFGLLLAPHARPDVDRFVDATIGPLLAWDAEHSRDLLGTLEGLYANSGNVTRAAAALFVHVNTLYQRIDRIRALLGVDPQDPHEGLGIQLALRLHRLRRDPPDGVLGG
jgi:GAF domain-containing protein